MGNNLSQGPSAHQADGCSKSVGVSETAPELLTKLLGNAGLFTNDQAADYIGVTPGTMEVWRSTKRYIIPYIKVGRLVKYRKTALDDYLASRTVEA